MNGIPARPVSRLAPTPSGFLHLGNAVNFLVTWALVRSRGGRLSLRIDDMDGIRFREDVLEDIFRSLDWLGLDWDIGPNGPDDFLENFSLQSRRAHYFDQLEILARKSGKTFTCTCSRSAIKKASTNGLYPHTCRHLYQDFVPGQNTIRVQVPDGARIRVNGHDIDLDQTFGDFVLWRRDDQPAYQLASLVEDEEAGVNFIVRGADLRESTAAQLYLADLFGFKGFQASAFIHHGLILGRDGQKLSKSRGAYALKDIRENGETAESAFQAAAEVMGLPGAEINSARALLQAAASTLHP
ncbi:MAG: glutamate--tRNA ligase family protein [Desulfobacterales bacterium]|nr:glutamate--tRNA ligase family protein [Desulfobacterales bacterium]